MPLDLSPSTRRVQRVRHELRRREVTVVRTQLIGANFIAITLTGDSLSDFVSGSFDDHVKFLFEGPSHEVVGRDYTPRSFNSQRRELTVEFAIHGAGPACDWARNAVPGSHATVGGPRSSFVIPADYDWHILAGDSTALPAIHRRVEELPRGTRATVLVQVDDAADERQFDSMAHLDVRWLRTSSDLAAAIADLQVPPGDGFTWCAGEASAMKRVRDILLVDKMLPRESVRVAAYWKLGASSHHETLD